MQFFDRTFTLIRRGPLGWLFGGTILLVAASSSPAHAQVAIVRQEFRDSTAFGWTVGGSFIPCLTANGPTAPGSIPNCGTTADVPGTGVLRLTNTVQD
ncbi:MAG: hypothetical protein AB1589_33035, partial [Cyanobacteriota bacterium]